MFHLYTLYLLECLTPTAVVPDRGKPRAILTVIRKRGGYVIYEQLKVKETKRNH